MIKFVSRLTLSGSRVDREAGIIKGVSLIALGEARGHNKSVDQKTLETVRDCARQYADGLRVKFNPSTFTHGAGTLAGYIAPDSIRVHDDKTIGDLHVYKSLPQEMRNYLFEMAEETPGNIGLSIEFTGDDEEIDGNKVARCSEIFAATVVDLPAANPTGLFSVKDNANSNKDTLDMNEEQVTKLTSTIVDTLKAGFTEIKHMFQAEPPKKDDEKEKEEMAAAGVTDADDEATKKTKLEAYRAASKTKVGDMNPTELGAVVKKEMMTFFRETGGQPARVTVENDDKGLDPFEKRVQTHLAAGARGRGVAIMRARRDAPKEYNEWRAKQNPQVNQMVRK